MASVSNWQERPVLGSDDSELGRVSAVLFHPAEPRVIGLQVDPPAFAYVVARQPRFVLLSDVRVDGQSFRLAQPKLPSDTVGERALQASWHDTVVWRGMPVRSAEGEHVGAVADVIFDAGTGAVTALRISTGVVGDAALGRLEVAGDLVRGFDGDAVVVLSGYSRIDAAGGAAKAAAAGVAAAKVHGERAAIRGLKAAGYAAGRVGRSFESGLGKRALDKLKSLMEDDE